MINYYVNRTALIGLIFFFLTGSISMLAQLDKASSVKLGLVSGLDTLGLKTGDMVFFQSMTFDAVMTQWGTLSPFTHSSMVVIDPDGTILLTHSTNNDYKGFVIPVIGEDHGRSGIILTRLDDLFISVDQGESGYYKHIWIRRMKESMMDRPERETILKLYHAYKHHPFETSNLRFILSAFDLNINGKDLLSLPPDSLWMCSEYMAHLFQDLSFPMQSNELPNETTPADIFRLVDGYYEEPVIYMFKDGKYQITQE